MIKPAYPNYTSKIFGTEYSSNKLKSLTMGDLVILLDEVNVSYEEAKWKYKTLPSKEKNEGNNWVIEDLNNLTLFRYTLRRVIFYKTKSKNAGLEKCKDAWKQRALYLGEKLGMDKEQVKKLVPVA